MTREHKDHLTSQRRKVTISVQLFGILLLVVLLSSGSAVWYFTAHVATSSNSKTYALPIVKTLRLIYPHDWRAVKPTSVLGVPSDALTAVEGKNDSGIVVVLPSGKAPALDLASADTISSDLARQYADYRLLSVKVVSLEAEKALLITYLRTRQGVLHTVTILPAGQQSFIIESASPPSSSPLGAEIGKIILSAIVISKV